MRLWLSDILQKCLDFSNILNASITASWVILAVLCLRLFLKKAPKWTHVALWGLVALRLLLPFPIESVFSLIPSTETLPSEILAYGPVRHAEAARLDIVTNPIFAEPVCVELPQTVGRVQGITMNWTFLWLGGMAVMGLYTILTYWRLRHRVREAVRVRENIYQCGSIPSPFVLGLFRPKIFLPRFLSEQDIAHVIAHEKAHIRRKDHWWKPLGFLLLTIHWFNPLMWLAYILLCRDIELACDEKVVKTLGRQARADYSQALLKCSIDHRSIAACPLAFGEIGVAERIKNILRYKKPRFWIILTAILLGILAGVCFLTDPLDSSVVNPWVQEYVPGTGNILGNVDKAYYETVSPDFAIGADQYGRAVFQNPHQAFDTFRELYGECIRLIQEQEDLPALTQSTTGLYKKFGWQLTEGTDEQKEQARFVTKFLDIYENSFSREIPVPDTERIPTAEFMVPGSFTAMRYENKLMATSVTLQEDGSFWFSFSPISSYIGHGTYSIRDGRLVLPTDDGRFIYYFDIRDNNTLAFDAQSSSEMTWFSELRDGELLIRESTSTNTPLEQLPKDYNQEQAEIDGLLVIRDNWLLSGQHIWDQFLWDTQKGLSASVRVYRYYTEREGSCFEKELYEIHFDGSIYTLNIKTDTGIESHEYRYLRYFYGDVHDKSLGYDAIERYILTNDPETDWEEIWRSAASSRYGDLIPHYVVYTNLFRYADHPSIPEFSAASLEMDGQILACVTESDALNCLNALLCGAEGLGYEPKTFNLGVSLALTAADGSIRRYSLDLLGDTIVVDQLFYDYGPGYVETGAYDGQLDLFAVFGLERWPDAVYEKYANWLGPIPSAEPETEPADLFPGGIMSVWFPDWRYAEINGVHPNLIVDILSSTTLTPTDQPQPTVEDSQYTIHIGYDNGEEFDLVSVGGDQFFYRVFKTQKTYTLTSPELRQAIDAALKDAS